MPVVTPFDGNGDVDSTTLTAAIERGLDAGVRGIVSCGTTGEYYALSEAERIEVMRHTHEVAAGRAQLVAGCNAGSTRMATLFARIAVDTGYDALMLAAPPTSLPRAHELATHFSAIAEASGLPIILYNYPARSGVEIDFDCLDRVADHPLIVGIKESSGDFSRFLALRDRYAGRITIMCGSDDQAVDYFFWGVRSWMAASTNGMPGNGSSSKRPRRSLTLTTRPPARRRAGTRCRQVMTRRWSTRTASTSSPRRRSCSSAACDRWMMWWTRSGPARVFRTPGMATTSMRGRRRSPDRCSNNY